MLAALLLLLIRCISDGVFGLLNLLHLILGRATGVRLRSWIYELRDLEIIEGYNWGHRICHLPLARSKDIAPIQLEGPMMLTSVDGSMKRGCVTLAP